MGGIWEQLFIWTQGGHESCRATGLKKKLGN
jgi:hypothetical protein